MGAKLRSHFESLRVEAKRKQEVDDGKCSKKAKLGVDADAAAMLQLEGTTQGEGMIAREEGTEEADKQANGDSS